jgi:hypothetical protein
VATDFHVLLSHNRSENNKDSLLLQHQAAVIEGITESKGLGVGLLAWGVF